MLVRYFLLCIGILYSKILLSQNYQISNFGIDDGLPLANVTSIAEDKLGYLWIGFYGGGVAQFDGIKFKVYNISDGLVNNIVNEIYIDNDNTVWITTIKGISWYYNNEFRNISLPYVPLGYKLIETEQDFIVYTVGESFIYLINKNKLSKKRELGSVLKSGIKKIFKSDTGIYIQTISGKLFHQLDGIYHEVLLKEKIETAFLYRNKLVIVSSGLAYLVENLNVKQLKLKFSNKYNVSTDSKNTTWFFEDGLLTLVDLSNKKNRVDFKLPNEPIVVYLDSEDNIWLGTYDQGLKKIYRNSFFKLFTNNIFNGQYIYSIREDEKNRIWVGSKDSGLGVCKGDSLIKMFYFEKEPNKNHIVSLDQDSVNVYVAAQTGLAKVDKKTLNWNWLSDTINVFKLKKINGDKLWVILQNGSIGSFENGKFNLARKYNEFEGWISDFDYSNYHRCYFLVTDRGKLIKFNGEQFTEIKIEGFTDCVFLSIGFYNDKLIISSDSKGIAIIDTNGKLISIVDSRNGLASDLIKYADCDSNNIIWAGTLYGIDAIRLDQKYNVKSIEHFSKKQGFEGIKSIRESFFFNQNGDSYFGSIDNVYKYYKEPYDVNDYPLHMRKFTIGNKVIELKDTINFKYTEDDITFEFLKINKNVGVNFNYKFKLNGEIIKSSDSTSGKISFSQLAPGTYRLQVNVVRSEMVLETSETFFQVEPHFYQTNWFKLIIFVLSASLFLFIIFFFNYLKEKKLKYNERVRIQEQNKIRREIGRDFHDEIGNQLARIINYISLLKISKKFDLLILNKAEYSAKYLMSGTKDFLWAIDPINDNLFNLFVHLKDFGQNILDEKNIYFDAKYLIKNNLNLPHGFSRHLNYIFKEAITNAFKHSDATRIELKFNYLNGLLEIELSDNGKGIQAIENLHSLGGLENIRIRSNLLKANISFSPNYPCGLRITLILKINKE